MSGRAPGLGAAVLVLASLAAGCFSDHPAEPTGQVIVSFANDIQPIFSGNCASSGCHGTVNPNPGNKPMVLAAGQSYDNIVGVSSAQVLTMQRIRAGQPDNSYLIHKVQGTHGGVGGSGVRMPAGRSALSQGQIDLLRTWVANGAPRN